MRSAEIVDYEIDVTFTCTWGRSQSRLSTPLTPAAKSPETERQKISCDVARSAISAAVHVQGVQRVEVNSPPEDIKISDIRAARNIGYHIENGGTDE